MIVDVIKKTRKEKLIQRKCDHAVRNRVTLRFKDGTLHQAMSCAACGNNRCVPWDSQPHVRHPNETSVGKACVALSSASQALLTLSDRQRALVASMSQQYSERGWLSQKQIRLLRALARVPARLPKDRL